MPGIGMGIVRNGNATIGIEIQQLNIPGARRWTSIPFLFLISTRMGIPIPGMDIPIRTANWNSYS